MFHITVPYELGEARNEVMSSLECGPADLLSLKRTVQSAYCPWHNIKF